MLSELNCYFQGIDIFDRKDGSGKIYNLSVVTEDDRLVGMIPEKTANKILNSDVRLFSPCVLSMKISSGVNQSGYPTINARMVDLEPIKTAK